MTNPSVGISSCLLGNAVRFDGGHKRDSWLASELGKFVKWVPVCPEMEMGMGVPRESIRLIRRGGIHLIGNESETDYTQLAVKTAKSLVDRTGAVDGFILKKNSPSCGLERVKVHGKSGIPDRTGRGFFAAELVASSPLIPVIEEGRLTDFAQREHFVTRIFAHHRWRGVPKKISSIQAFHQSYKFLMLAHSPVHYQRLGGVAANPRKRKPTEVRAEYEALFFEGLAIPATTRKQVNVLQHLFGYFKTQITAKHGEAVRDGIEEFRKGELSFLAAFTSIKHLLHQYPSEYLSKQVFFDPYPRPLNLRRYL